MKNLTRLSLLIMSFALVACGGGGGGGTDDVANSIASVVNSPSSTSSGTDTTPNPDITAVAIESGEALTISWISPSYRDSGEVLSSDEIQGYVVIYVSEDELSSGPLLESVLGADAPTLEEFKANPVLSDYLSGDDIETLISSGSVNIVILPSNASTTHTFNNLSQDNIYYFSVSSYDFDNIYGKPGETVSAQIL